MFAVNISTNNMVRRITCARFGRWKLPTLPHSNKTTISTETNACVSTFGIEVVVELCYTKMASGNSDSDENIPQLHRKKRKNRCLSSSDDDSNTDVNSFYTPTREKDEDIVKTRSSERIRQKHSKVFSMPKKKDVLDQIPSSSSPSKSIDGLRPRKLINDLMKATNRYNHSPAETDGDESNLEFIDDSLDEEDSECSSISDSYEKNDTRKSKKCQKFTGMHRQPSSVDHGCDNGSTRLSRANIFTDSSEDTIVPDAVCKCLKRKKRSRKIIAKALCSSSDSEELANNEETTIKCITLENCKNKNNKIGEYSSEENCEAVEIENIEVFSSQNSNRSVDDGCVNIARRRSRSLIIDSDDSEKSEENKLCRSDRTANQQEKKKMLWKSFREARKSDHNSPEQC